MKRFQTFLLLAILFFLSSCQKADQAAAPSPNGGDTGVAGSYARFIIVNSFMYIVDESSIKTFNLSEPSTPQQVDEQTIGERIESIFHFENKLFVGSGAGLFIYEIGSNGIPSQLSATAYFDTFDTFGCDPVVANTTHAYVTLNSRERVDAPCGGLVEIDVNELRVYDIEDITNPVLVAIYPMTAPKGVGLDGNTLFICDDDQGLKIFDVTDPLDIQLIKHFDTFTAFDVIPLDGLLLVVGPDNVYQFNYLNLENIYLLSEIPYGA